MLPGSRPIWHRCERSPDGQPGGASSPARLPSQGWRSRLQLGLGGLGALTGLGSGRRVSRSPQRAHQGPLTRLPVLPGSAGPGKGRPAPRSPRPLARGRARGRGVRLTGKSNAGLAQRGRVRAGRSRTVEVVHGAVVHRPADAARFPSRRDSVVSADRRQRIRRHQRARIWDSQASMMRPARSMGSPGCAPDA